jgi:pilus assembly protein CpaF
VIHLAMESDGRRRVREIVGVGGRVEGDVIETSELFVMRGARLRRGNGHPPRPERFASADVDIEALLAQHASPRDAIARTA